MNNQRISCKELKKTDRRIKKNYYPQEKTDYGKNGNQPPKLLK
jgi:hypothetical protein